MYVKVVYIVSNCHKNSTRIVKKMSFRDKMAKKSGGGTPYPSISDMLLGFHARYWYISRSGTQYLSPLMILYYV